MNAKVMEVFRSIQGEGVYAGAAQVFVRFFECNMHCSWCDTPASIGDTSRKYKDVSAGDLLEQIRELYEGCHSVSITGGEPLLQADFLKTFLPMLKKSGMTVYLETNGTLPKELKQVIKYTDIVAMDLKLPTSTGEKPFWKEHEAFLKVAILKPTFLKVVITPRTLEAEVDRAVELVRRVAPKLTFILQPNYFDMKDKEVIARCVALQKHCSKVLNDVRIIPQMHKFMKLR
jgi:organic radical activating enzyme